jgi:Arc/MetJ-type ribon-helix-helix transcriptional regulator
MIGNTNTGWTGRKPRLNKKLVVRVPTQLFNELQEYVNRTQRFITISEFVRYLLVQSLNKDQFSSQMETGRMGVGKNGKVGSETETKGREWKENQ